MIRSTYYSYVVYRKKGLWYYLDNNEKVDPDNPRPCLNCGQKPTTEGHDDCIANLLGVKYACCGHGNGCGYISFINGKIIRSQYNPKRFQRILKILKP